MFRACAAAQRDRNAAAAANPPSTSMPI